MHKPILLEHDDAAAIVIFIHGFMGSPNQFTFLTDAVFASGYSCASVLLPGHGGDGKSFAANGLQNWEDCVQTEIERHTKRYARIFLVGHSMGGLLALNASIQNSDAIRGVAMLSSPTHMRFFAPRSIWARLCLLCYKKGQVVKRDYLSAYSISNVHAWEYLTWRRPIAGLFRLIKKTRSNLADVSVPVLLFHSRMDEAVSFKSAAILSEGLSGAENETVVLQKSWHAHYTPEERVLLRERLLCFLVRCSANAADSNKETRMPLPRNIGYGE